MRASSTVLLVCGGVAVAHAFATPPASRPVRHFINLSNGAEALGLLDEAGIKSDAVHFCRLQSSHCEAQDFNGVLQSLDADLLMHLALGFECRVYDFGSRGNYWEGPDGEPVLRHVPRAMWWGLEWSRYALTRLWHLEGEAAAEPPLLRGYNVAALFEQQMRQIPKPLWKRLKYYRSHLAPGLDEVHLRGYYASTELDGNKEAYRTFLREYAERAGADSARAAPPPPESFGMAAYDARVERRVGEMRGRQGQAQGAKPKAPSSDGTQATTSAEA